MENKKRMWVSIGLTVAIAGALTTWGIYRIGHYGIALFILTPLFIGTGSTLIYGRNNQLTKKESMKISFLTLGVFVAGLLIFAIEGVNCIFMAAPFAVLLTWIGSLIGHAIIQRTPQNATKAMLVLIAANPTVAFLEKDNAPTLIAVVSSIEINAKPSEVWKNVVEFPQLDEPTEFIFKTGIAYPINAKIEGTGVGAVRHCNFTTGSFVEPITVWDEPHLLKFDVDEQPAPMKELSFWDIDAPHLHDYFVSKQGQFKLTALPNGNTLLEGTTWYYHNIHPAFYWQLWSDHIIHKIHERVLKHIKRNAENVNEVVSNHLLELDCEILLGNNANNEKTISKPTIVKIFAIDLDYNQYEKLNAKQEYYNLSDFQGYFGSVILPIANELKIDVIKLDTTNNDLVFETESKKLYKVDRSQIQAKQGLILFNGKSKPIFWKGDEVGHLDTYIREFFEY